MISFAELFGYTAIPVAAMILAGALAVFRAPGPKLRSAIMHLAAGVVFAVVAIELLPGFIHSTAIISVVIGFVAGAGLMLLIRELVGGHGDEHEEGGEDAGASEAEHAHDSATEGRLPTGMLVAIAVDLFVDGIMLGIGFAAGERAGVLLVIALTLEAISLGLATAAALRQRGIKRRRVNLIVAVLALLLAVGAVAGGLGIRALPASVIPGVLAFGCAALLFLVTEELLEEAHEVKETPVLTMMFFVGFLVLMVLEMLGASAHA